jgi:hypothetical protein
MVESPVMGEPQLVGVAVGLALADDEALALAEGVAVAVGEAVADAGVVGAVVEEFVGAISGEVMAVKAKSAPPISRANTTTVATTTAVIRRSSDQLGQMTLRSSSNTPRR